MTSLLSSEKPNLPAPVADEDDPFVSRPKAPSRQRYSHFDEELFVAGPGSSPRQAKRALEAHLAETERRLDEAGKLGTALVAQRKVLAEQLQEIEALPAEDEISPNLRQRLVDVEKEYNDLSRESARALLPKQRVPSNEAAGSPYVPEGRSGRRSVSPSKFESQATAASKLSVPNRKVRNQPSNRVHDIEFVTEISTSLLAQVRNLQAALAEREEDVREVQSDRQRLEIDSETLQQRLKTLDDSEQRYKEENWNLETRLQEFNVLQREASDKEKKLTQALNMAKAGQVTTQKELDELKLSHAKLTEDHAASSKHHDIELGSAKRGAAVAETERLTMQKKIEDLTNQNMELAKAFSSQRGRTSERDVTSGVSEDDFDSAADHITPEHSPPPSPVKGTPRHSMLETETVKTSLLHAQRTIQSQRSQLHREKTEKMELRRIIQEQREELERSRADGGAVSNRRPRKADAKDAKRPPHLLGSFRSSRNEIITDDPDWENDNDNNNNYNNNHNHNEGSPRSSPLRESPILGGGGFDATEASESAFETANERATETEDFQTGNEDMSGAEDAETETEETISRGFGKMKRTPALPAPAGLTRPGNRSSFHSTASTSADEDDFSLGDLKTPTSRVSSQRNTWRSSRGVNPRNSRQLSEEPALQGSPASSRGDTPLAGQSLFVELQDLGSDEESVGRMTPSRRSTRSLTPGSARRAASPPPAVPTIPKLVMTDSGVMTDPVSISSLSGMEGEEVEDYHVPGKQRPFSMESVIRIPPDRHSWISSPGTESNRPISTFSDTDMEGKLAQFPAPPTVQPLPPSLQYSGIQSEDIEPVADLPPTPPPTLKMIPISSEHVEPVAEPVVPPRALSLSTIASHSLQPVSEPEPSLPALSLSSIQAHSLQPRAEPVEPYPALSLSSISAHSLRPVAAPAPASVPAPLSLSTIAAEHVQPVASPVRAPPMESPVIPTFGFAPLSSVETLPVSPRSPRRDGIIFPRGGGGGEAGSPQTPRKLTARDNVFIAEDASRQSPRESPAGQETPESQKPFREISSNASARQSPRKLRMSDQGAQTSMTAGDIDEMTRARRASSQQGRQHQKTLSGSSIGTPGTTGTVRIHRDESPGSPVRPKKFLDEAETSTALRRPGSAASGRASLQNVVPPPLPQNHKEIIEAARTSSSYGAAPGPPGLPGPSGPSGPPGMGLGSMGPPLWPASSAKPRPTTPGQRPISSQSARGTPTPRAMRHSHMANRGQSRQSSVSSFASELDTRFGIRPGELGVDPSSFGANTDPRMIQAITQTMIGEYLWKYTRKTGRGEMSDKRHRRYFWLHPYTKTLYWSERDPSSAGLAELKTRSVPIEAVRVVTDDNPMPPGLHRKSIVVLSPGRTVKFTCTTGQRHETWFNALSYLLLRTAEGQAADTEEMAEHITREDVNEFNPAFGRRTPPLSPNMGGGAASFRPRPPPSLSSYHSRSMRNESPTPDRSMDIPTLAPPAKATAGAPKPGTFSRLSTRLRSGGPFSSLRGRALSGPETSIYEASEVHDSAEDLREMIERQDRDSDRLENVRACCDGKHDVGTIPYHSRRGRGHTHSHPRGASGSTPISLRTRP